MTSSNKLTCDMQIKQTISNRMVNETKYTLLYRTVWISSIIEQNIKKEKSDCNVKESDKFTGVICFFTFIWYFIFVFIVKRVSNLNWLKRLSILN